MNRFLWGVEGVKDGGGKDELALGGVCVRVPPRELGMRGSETPAGYAVGMLSSNISDRNSVENVRFASSATQISSCNSLDFFIILF